jgi:hypothetical protein
MAALSCVAGSLPERRRPRPAANGRNATSSSPGARVGEPLLTFLECRGSFAEEVLGFSLVHSDAPVAANFQHVNTSLRVCAPAVPFFRQQSIQGAFHGGATRREKFRL